MHKEGFTKYEVARILGARALQLSMNAPILLVIPKDKLEDINYDPLKIAEHEFEAGVLPITVKRPLPERTETENDEEEAEILQEMPLEEAAPEKKAEDDADEKVPDEAPAAVAE